MRRNKILVYALCAGIIGAAPWIAQAGETDPCLIQTLLNPTPEPFDSFGFSVAMAEGDVVIGAPADNSAGTNAGAAYLFDTNGDLLQTYLNPTPASGDNFGLPVTAIGNNVVVAASGHNSPFDNSGAVYLFDTNGNLLETFSNPSPVINGNFGRAVAVVGGNLLIGAHGNGPSFSLIGAAYLFDVNGNHLASFLNPTPENDDHFGISVAAVGNDVLIGAWQDNTGAPDAGAAYLFTPNGNLSQSFFNPTPENGDHFGWTVCAMGNDVLVGAPDHDGSGAAYLFDGSNGDLLQTFLNPTPESGDNFGYSIVAVGDNVLIGAIGDNTSGPSAGAAYLFDTNGNLLNTYLNPSPEESDVFGLSVVDSGDIIIIGAARVDDAGPDAGAAYIYSVIDSDGDGVCDIGDICQGGNDNIDGDGDGVPEWCDPCPFDNPDDSDGDGVCDSDDPCPLDNPDDTDGDGVCDSDDLCVGDDATGDSDGDGFCDDVDICQGDDASGDVDADGICGDIDNCLDHANADQADCDDDGDGDVCTIAECANEPACSDCDENGIPDACDIADGAEDQNGNGVPDACEGPMCGDCPTDVDGSGDTGASDLAVLLGSWGPCLPEDACECLDDNADGVIGAADLAVLLGSWGPCE